MTDEVTAHCDMYRPINASCSTSTHDRRHAILQAPLRGLILISKVDIRASLEKNSPANAGDSIAKEYQCLSVRMAAVESIESLRVILDDSSGFVICSR